MENGKTLDPMLYRQIASQWLTGVAVVTSVQTNGRPAGLTMNAVAPLSLSPPQFLINLDLKSDTLAAVRESLIFCINFLGENQGSLCRRFATKDEHKFENLDYHAGVCGAPMFKDTIGHAECVVETIHESGDHAIVIGNLVAGAARGGEPLVYFTSGFRVLSPSK